MMKPMSKWLWRALATKGAVSLEFALVLPAVLLIVWTFWQMSEAYRMQWDLNRQSAALADMMINQPEDFDTPGTRERYHLQLELQLTTLTIVANNVLKEALGKDNPDLHTGIAVEYVPGTTAPDGEVLSYRFSAGRRCPTMAAASSLLSLTGDAGGPLTPPSTAANSGMRLLRVQACVQHQNRPAYMELFGPKEYVSQATAVRKES